MFWDLRSSNGTEKMVTGAGRKWPAPVDSQGSVRQAVWYPRERE